MKKRLFLWCGLLVLLASAARAAPERAMVLGVHPFLAAAEIHARFTPLANHLAAAVGRPVRIDVAPDYASHIERVGRGEVDIAFLGPAPYLSLVERFGPQRLLARLEIQGEPVYRGVIIVPAQSPLRDLSELRGHSFAFGAPESTMGYMVPRAMLQKAGVPLSSLAEHVFLHNHENVVFGVLMGQFSAGAVKDDVFEQHRERGLRALGTSPPVPNHVFVAAPRVSRADEARLRKAMLELRDTQILSRLNPGLSALIPAKDSDYDALRTLLAPLAHER